MADRWLMALLVAACLGSGAGAAAAESGEALFQQHCASCHGPAAEGTPGLAPPLLHPQLWQRLGTQAPRYLAGVMTGGMSGALQVDGVDYVGLVMPPQSHLDASTLERIGHYLMRLNRQPQALTAELIESLRAAPLSHGQLRRLRQGG